MTTETADDAGSRRRALIVLAALVALMVIAAAGVFVFTSRDQAQEFRITVIEGLTVNATLDALAAQTEHTVADYAGALLDGSVTSSLLPAAPTDLRDWEGLLFPDTYEITDRYEPAQILQRLADTMESRVAGIDWGFVEGRGLRVYDGIVIASMIEREAGIDPDRPLIASVIYNRLDIDMRLQIDATVVYALGYYPAGGLTLSDLEVESPYNTYAVEGLPPTPIAGAGLASLQAAAGPADSDYLFYVLGDAAGGHTFTRTYEEHLAAIERSREAGLLP